MLLKYVVYSRVASGMIIDTVYRFHNLVDNLIDQ